MISKKYIPLLLVLFATMLGCCKVAFLVEDIDKIQFKNFTINEIDTFYVLPVYKDSVISFSDYHLYQETTLNSSATLKKRGLDPWSAIQIVLKDTSIKYEVSVTKTHTEKLGKGRCAGQETKIDSIQVNNQVLGGNQLIITK